MKDDIEPATECAKPDPLAKLFDPSQYPKNEQLSTEKTLIKLLYIFSTLKEKLEFWLTTISLAFLSEKEPLLL